MAWCNRQATIWHSLCGGVTHTRWTVVVIERCTNIEPFYLERQHKVAIKIIYDMLRGQQMTPEQGVTQGNPQG